MGDEREAREQIGTLLAHAGWLVRDVEAANILAAHGGVIRAFY